jgi:hypothetical protein
MMHMMPIEQFMCQPEMKNARLLAEKRWGKVKDPTWRLVCRLALTKKMRPSELMELIAGTEHPGDLFVK